MEDFAMSEPQGGLEFEMTVTTAVTRSELGAPSQTRGFATSDRAQVSIHVQQDRGVAHNYAEVDDEEGQCLAFVATSSTSVVRTHLKHDSPSASQVGRGLATVEHQRLTPGYGFATQTNFPANKQVSNTSSSRILQSTLREAATDTSMELSCSLSTTIMVTRHGHEDDRASSPEPITVEEVLPEEQYHEALPGRSEVATSNTHPDEKKKFVIFLPRPRNWDRQETDEIAADETAQAELLEGHIHFPSTSTPALQSQNLSHPTMLPKPSSSQSQKHSNLAQTSSSNERLSAIPDSQIVGEKRQLSLEPQLGVSGTSTTTSGQSSSITRSSELRADRRGTSDVGFVRHELTRPRSPGEVSTRSGITGASTTRGQLLPPATALARSELTVTYSQYQATQNNLGVQSSMHLRALHLQPIDSSSTSDPLLQVGAEAQPLDSLSGTGVHGSHSNQSKYSETEGLWQGEGPNDANDNFLSARALSRASSSQPVRIDNATDGNKTSTFCNIHVNGEEARDIGIEMQTGSDAQSKNKERDKLVPVPYPKVDDVFGCQIQATPVPMPVLEAHSNDVRRRVSASGLTITDNGVLKIVSITGEEAKLCSPLDEVEESKDLTGHTLIPQVSIQESSINRTPEPSQAATDMDRGGKNFSKERTTTESKDGDKGPHCDTDMDKTLSSVHLIPGRAMEQHILIDDVTQFGEKTVAEALVSTEISTQSDGVLDAVLTEHFVLVAMQPPQTVGQHVESATLPDSPSSTSCELPEAGMSGVHSVGSKQSTTKRDNIFSSAPRVSTLPRETQKLFLADSEAKSNLYTAINTSDGPETICAIHKPDEDLPETNCFLHKPDEVTTARSSTPPFSPLLDTGMNPTPQPSLASELAGELCDGGPSGPAKEPEEATAASTALHLETETELKASIPVQEGIAISKFQSSQIEGEPSSTTRSANSALVGPSNNEMHLQQVSEQGLHPASQPRQRVGQESQTTGGVLEQDRRGESSMTECRQQVPPTEVQVCQVPGPCPFCLGHRLLATGKAKLNIFDSSQITSAGSAANQDQSAFTQGTEAGSSQESDKGQQGSSPDSPQLALSPVIAAPAVLFTGTHHKDSSGGPSTSTISGLTNKDRQLDSAAKDGDIPTNDAYIKEGPEKPSDPTKLQDHLLRGHEAQAFKQEGQIFPSVDTPVEKELNTQENSTPVLRVESDLFFVDQQDHSRTNTELDHEIARQSQLSPTPLELEMPSLNATVQSNLVATSKQSSPTDGHANATNKDTCMHDNLQGPDLLKGPSNLGSKRGSTTTTVLASLPPADGFDSPLIERTVTSLEACPQEVPSGSAEHQDTNSADKTCCYPAANKRERRLTETTNMQETLLGFPTPEKDTSTATTPEQTVQQKTSDASDSVPPNPGEARDLEHQGSARKILCCYPLVRRDSKSTIQDTCMHDNQIGLNQPNHQSSHTTASKDGSKESEKLGAEKPLDTTITTSILLADCSENLAGEQKSPQGSFHVPRLSTCCFSLKTTPVESESKDSPGTFATVATEPSIKENENENTDSSVKTCCYPASYKKKGGLTATTNMQEPLIESPTIEHQGSGGKICCYPLVRREKNSTIQDTCMHDNQIGLNQPNHQSIHTTASKDGSDKSEKLDPETPLDTTINTSIPLADRSENLADEQKSPQASFHVPRLSTCCFPVKTTPVESQSKDSPETFATVATEPSIKEIENQNADSAVKTCCYPASYKKERGLTAITNMQEPLIESPTIEHQGSGGKICCYPLVRREKNSIIQDTCMHDNQIGLNQPNHQSIHTTASKDGSEKSEKLDPETPLDTTINTSIQLADRSENLADEQKSPQGSFHVPRLSTCCFPVKTTPVESQSKDSPGTFATVATEPSIKEIENQNTDSAVKTCCYPASYKKKGRLTATTNMQEPFIVSPTVGKDTSAATVVEQNTQQKTSDVSDSLPPNPEEARNLKHQVSDGKICCYPVARRESKSTSTIRVNQSDPQSAHTTALKDGSQESEDPGAETARPLDTRTNASIPVVSPENLVDEQKSPQHSFHVPKLSTCCFPVTGALGEDNPKDSLGTSAIVATEPPINESKHQNRDAADKTCCYPDAYKKERRVTSTKNMQEPVIESPPPEKDNSATTAAKETIQQKVSDSSDSLPPNPGHPDNRTICCYPFVGRESKSAIEDTRMQDKKTVINQSDHQSAHGTAFTEGSQKSEKLDAESTAPLETTTTTSIPILDDSRNLVDEQKSPCRSFHVPKMSCCFPVPVTTPSDEDHPKHSSGTPATVTTEPSIKENEMMIARSSLATTQVVHEDGTESTVTSQMFLVAVDDPNSAPQSIKTVPEVPSASDGPELQTFMFKDEHQITVEDSEKKQDTSRMVGITSGRCMPEKGETCQNIRKHLKRIKSKLLTCKPKVGEASSAGPQPLLVSTVPVSQEKKDEAMCLEEQEAAARAAALREQELAVSIERIKEATLCRKRLLDRQKQESGMHPDLDPYLQFRLCSERTMRRQKAIAAQAERDRQRQFSQVQRGLATSREWEESRRMSPAFFDAKSAAERMRRRQIFLESEQDVFAFAGLAEARDNLVATKRRNMTRAATDGSIARKEAKLMAKRRQDRHMHEAILWEAKRRRHRIAWEARHAGLRIMDRDRQLATKEEEKRQLSLLDTLEILDARTEQENQALETWYDNYKCGPEMPEGDGPEFSIDYFADTASEDEDENVQEIGTAEQISEPNTVQPLIQPVPTYKTAQPTVAPIS